MIAERETTKTNLKGLSSELLLLKLTDVVPSNTNPRLTLDKEPFEELKKSIFENGLLQPIVVRPLDGGPAPASPTYEIIGGHRRFQAIVELHREHPNDKRFARIPVVVRDVDANVVPVLQLVENINREDLSPIEVAEGIVKALDAGVEPDRLAEQLGWKRRNLNRYIQFHEAPAWLKSLATEVKVTTKKLNEGGDVVLDKKTDKPVLEVERYPGLPFTYVLELIILYNVLHEHDALLLEENGGDGFRPQAERVVRRLGTLAAVEAWTTPKLRAEIKRAKDPKPKRESRDEANELPALLTSGTGIKLDMTRAAAFTTDQLTKLAIQLTQALRDLGFKKTNVAL